jgi:hypothetical protein
MAPVLVAISDCSPWCQTLLFDAISHYIPTAAEDTDVLIDRFIPFMTHSNPAVVIGAFRCIFGWLPKSSRDSTSLLPSIVPPFVTLLTSASPEVQYVVLRSLSLFIQRYPKSLSREIRVFFCKYNDPTYVKMEKLDIIVTICSAQTAELVLGELSEYSHSVDVSFVRKSIRAIGQIALKIEAASRRCVDILSELFTGKAEYAIEESVIVVTDILRRYPGHFESILQPACQSLTTVKDPRAKSAGIWLLGEYCGLIEGVDVLVDGFLDFFKDEEPLVQLQILSAVVKCYIARPDETRDQLQFVLTEASKEQCVPDVRNRALMYWRILSADPGVASEVVLFGKQALQHGGVQFEPAVLDELIRNLGRVSGVLHVISSTKIENEENEVVRRWENVKLNDAKLLELSIDWDRTNLYMKIANRGAKSLGGLAIAINRNAVGLVIVGQPKFPEAIAFGEVIEVAVPVRYDPGNIGNAEKSALQIAIRTDHGNVFGLARVPLERATGAGGRIGQETFRELYLGLGEGITVKISGAEIARDSVLAERNVFVVGKNEGKAYLAFQLPPDITFVAEVSQQGGDLVAVVKGQDAQVLEIVKQSVGQLFAKQ